MNEVEKVKSAITSAIINMGTDWFMTKVYSEFEKEMEIRGSENKIESLKILKDLMEIQTIKIQERIEYRLKRRAIRGIINKLIPRKKAL